MHGELAIGLFTLVDIPAGTELTFDYNFERYGDKVGAGLPEDLHRSCCVLQGAAGGLAGAASAAHVHNPAALGRERAVT